MNKFDDITCQKCGSFKIELKHIPEVTEEMVEKDKRLCDSISQRGRVGVLAPLICRTLFNTRPEAIKCTCLRCGFIWDEAPADKTGFPAGAGYRPVESVRVDDSGLVIQSFDKDGNEIK